MKKRFLGLIIAAFAALSLTFTVSAEAELKVGDYIKMGTYLAAPIIWRCVDIDENGPLMLSDRILCLKAFDASGENTGGSHGHGFSFYPVIYLNNAGVITKIVYDTKVYYRHRFGSNNWADSNMRAWLNSMSPAGKVKWSCGNPPLAEGVWENYNGYAGEAGFLNGFSRDELCAVKEVSQKSILDGYEGAGSSGAINPGAHIFGFNIEDLLKNYDTAYSEQVKDKVFLLDVKQLDAVYKNGDVLGEDYYIGKPTQQCVDGSEYETSLLSSDKNWYYWLRTPDAQTGSFFVRTVYSDGAVLSAFAKNSIYGVRPAFYLNLASASITDGNGTPDAPFSVSAGVSNWYTGMEASAEIDKESMTVTAEISRYNESDSNISAFIAAYDADGRVIGVEHKDILIEEAGTPQYIDFSVPDGTAEYKLFFWNSKMQPLYSFINGKFKYSELQDAEFESQHDISGFFMKTYTYTYDGNCDSIDMVFSEDTDFTGISIYDADGNLIGKYADNELAGKTVNIPGNTVKIKLTNYGSGAAGYGFKANEIYVNF